MAHGIYAFLVPVLKTEQSVEDQADEALSQFSSFEEDYLDDNNWNTPLGFINQRDQFHAFNAEAIPESFPKTFAHWKRSALDLQIKEAISVIANVDAYEKVPGLREALKGKGPHPENLEQKLMSLVPDALAEALEDADAFVITMVAHGATLLKMIFHEEFGAFVYPDKQFSAYNCRAWELGEKSDTEEWGILLMDIHT